MKPHIWVGLSQCRTRNTECSKCFLTLRKVAYPEKSCVMQGYQVSVIFHTPYLIRNTLPSESVGPLRRRCCLRRQCAYETRGPLRDTLTVLQEIEGIFISANWEPFYILAPVKSIYFPHIFGKQLSKLTWKVMAGRGTSAEGVGVTGLGVDVTNVPMNPVLEAIIWNAKLNAWNSQFSR